MDEAPDAYKEKILRRLVMEAQALVDVVTSFTPSIVKMDGIVSGRKRGEEDNYCIRAAMRIFVRQGK